MSKKRGVGELNYETKLIIELLEQATIGEIITYQMISDLIGQNILLRRYMLDNARKAVQRDNRIVFDTISGEGIIRVTEGDKSNVVDKRFTGIRKATDRAVRVLDTVDTSTLQRDELSRHMQQRSVAGLLQAHTRPQNKPEPKPKVGNNDTSATVQEFLAKHRKP